MAKKILPNKTVDTLGVVGETFGGPTGFYGALIQIAHQGQEPKCQEPAIRILRFTESKRDMLLAQRKLMHKLQGTGNILHHMRDSTTLVCKDLERQVDPNYVLPKTAKLKQDFLDFIEDSPMVAHNAGFDFNFINAELRLCDMPEVSRERMVDTVALAKVRHPGSKLSLDALCTRYGIDRSHRTKHGALLDAELLAQVYVELRGGRQIGLELVTETTEIVMETKVLVRRDRVYRQPRPHAATEAEQLAHAEFLKSVDTPLWGK